MAHMQPTTEFGEWLVIDGTSGVETVSMDYLSAADDPGYFAE